MKRFISFRLPHLVSVLLLSFYALQSYSFEAGEHALIGDLAFEKSAKDYANKIKSLEVNVSYRYGQLVALSGDLYKSIEEISLSDPSAMKDIYRNNRKALKKCVDKEIEAIRTQKLYGGCGDFKLIEKKVRYVTLAHDNYSHFAWHNLKQYIKSHEKSLWFAQLAYNKCTKKEWAKRKSHCKKRQDKNRKLISKSGYKNKLKRKYRMLPDLFPRRIFTKRYLNRMSKDKMVRLALFANAYADHFLTDTFAAGHLRIPRSQIDDFVKNYSQNEWKKDSDKREKGTAVSGALTKYLHNLDGAIDGLEVSNSLGEKFVVRSDRQLFSELNSADLSGVVEENPQAVQPILATSASLKEIINVIEHGKSSFPKKEFSALKYVPFILNNTENTLTSVVQRDIADQGSIKNVIKTMPTEMQLIFKGMTALHKQSYTTYFEAFVKAIPIMMQEFRNDIRGDAVNDSLRRRIPEKLLNAMLELR